MADNSKKKITLTLGDTELNFAIGIQEYNEFVNEFQPSNKVAPSENLLTRCVHPDQRDKLIEFCDMGLAMDMASALIEGFKPALKLSVKK